MSSSILKKRLTNFCMIPHLWSSEIVLSNLFSFADNYSFIPVKKKVIKMLELLYIDIYITLGIFLRKKVIETAGFF